MKISLSDLLAETLGPEEIKNRTGKFYGGERKSMSITGSTGQQQNIEQERVRLTRSAMQVAIAGEKFCLGLPLLPPLKHDVPWGIP